MILFNKPIKQNVLLPLTFSSLRTININNYDKMSRKPLMEQTDQDDIAAIGGDPTLLLVDDDKPFLQRLARAMETRGFTVAIADSVEAGLASVKTHAPAYAVVDMRLGDGNGLDIIEAIRARREDTRAVILTGYGNIATAVNAVKLGAIDYLSKPADADEVFAALTRRAGEKVAPPENPMSADRVRWEHIQRVYEMCDRNVSETARRLNMHRRTLQRILAKRAPR